MDIEDIKYNLSREKEFMVLAQRGQLGISECEYHYPLVNDSGVIQCGGCLAFFENEKAIIHDLWAIHGQWEDELRKLKIIQHQVRAGEPEEPATLYEFEATNGRIKLRYFYDYNPDK